MCTNSCVTLKNPKHFFLQVWKETEHIYEYIVFTYNSVEKRYEVVESFGTHESFWNSSLRETNLNLLQLTWEELRSKLSYKNMSYDSEENGKA